MTSYGDIHLGNWRTAPFNRRSLTRVREIIPTADIAAGREAGQRLPRAIRDLSGLAVAVAGGGTTTLGAALEASFTDAVLVLHQGAAVFEWYRNEETASRPHIVFSVSKSITALLAGILWGDGLLDPESPVTRYLPEVAGSAYGDATVRHVLDMTVAMRFEENYAQPDETFLRYREASGWNPRRPGSNSAEGLARFLTTLERGEWPHGDRFRYYSPNSDVLGLIIERAAGRRFSDLMSERLWQPMGAGSDAYITVDPGGAPRTAGGICTTIEDLARLGELVRCRGVVAGRQVVPGAWLDDIRAGGSAEAWQKGDLLNFLPVCRYRSKWYNRIDVDSLVAAGIHGQWISVARAAGVVVAKHSSQPVAADDAMDRLNMAIFDSLAAALS